MLSSAPRKPITDLLESIIDNRGRTVPTSDTGTPLIATNCIKDDELYPVFEKVRYVDDETMKTWFRAHLRSNDILFVNKGTPGRVALVPDPVNFCAAQDMMGLRVDEEKVNYKYLFAILRSYYARKFIENNHVGLVIPHFRKQELKTLMIPVPSESLQTTIGEMYVSMSEKIDLNNRINAELESLARTIYDYWFLQFDFPDSEGRPYRSSGGAMRFDEETKWNIPKGWSIKPLSEIADITMGQSPPGTSLNSDELGTVFYQGCTDFTKRFPVNRLFTTDPKRLANKGDILLSVRAPVGTLNIANESCCIGRGVAALSSKSGHNNFLYYVLVYLGSVFERRNSDGTTFGSITKSDLFSLPVVVPPVDILNQFDSYVNPMAEMIDNASYENIELSALRDWLLPLLMSGEVRVGE